MTTPGTKSTRRERHKAAMAEQRDRKRLRRERAVIHAAMRAAEARRKYRRQGRRTFDVFMRDLGSEPLCDRMGRVGREIPGDVLAKYRPIP